MVFLRNHYWANLGVSEYSFVDFRKFYQSLLDATTPRYTEPDK
jgi:hypothetical protein